MKSTTPQNHQAEETIDAINKKTGRNMPQAIGTAVVLIVLILACSSARRSLRCLW